MIGSRAGATSVPASAAVEIGGRLAQARSESGLTLAAVAEGSGLSPGYISQIESGSANPTLSTLVKLASALGRELDQLIDKEANAQASSDRPLTPRFTSLPVAAFADEVSAIWDLSAVGSSKLSARLVRAVAGDHAELVSHSGEEFIFVLAGTARLTVGGTSNVLGVNDVCHFAATDPHQVSEVSPDLLLLVALSGD